MSRKTIKAFEKHTGRESPGVQGVTFRDARKPGLGPHDPEQEQIDRLRRYVRANMSGCDAAEDSRTAPTLPPPPASVEVACLMARAQELEDTARMMLARAAELRHVAAAASESKPEPEPGPRFRSRFEFKHQ